MTSADLLADAFGRVRDIVHRTVDGLAVDQLAFRPTAHANSIAWLVWHLTRVQDDHICNASGADQAWVANGWAERFDLPFDPAATGYGHTSDEVAAVQATSELLTGYYDTVHAHTIDYVARLTDADLPRIVDTSWDPPVSLGVRLISVIGDSLQHAGQAAYVRGLLPR